MTVITFSRSRSPMPARPRFHVADVLDTCSDALGRPLRTLRSLRRPVRPSPRDAFELERDRLHELRATVAGLATSYHLLHDGQLSDDERERIDRLYDLELARLQRLLDDRPDTTITAVDLALTIDPLVATMRLRGHSVDWTGTRTLARGRPDAVTEIVHVLLENAARHGGGDIVVTAADRGQYAEVTVRDHGPGVPDALRPRLFERGVRGPQSSGDGLGLDIASRPARELGGSNRLAPPRPGRPGAEFLLTLPTFSERRSWPDMPV